MLAQSIALVLDEPAPGAAFIAAEGASVSVWSYLYGDGAADVVKRDEPRWAKWLADHAPGQEAYLLAAAIGGDGVAALCGNGVGVPQFWGIAWESDGRGGRFRCLYRTHVREMGMVWAWNPPSTIT